MPAVIENSSDGASRADQNDSTSHSDDPNVRAFQISFQEHRLRFDQQYPEGLEGRLPADEFDSVLEHVHRELVGPLEKSQKAVRKWTIVCCSTAVIAVGFLLTPVLAHRLHLQQIRLRRFWLQLRAHLKTLNRDIYLPRGIEWRVERDREKMEGRDAYNKLYGYRIEVILRRPVKTREERERERLAQEASMFRGNRSDHGNGRMSTDRTTALFSDHAFDSETLAAAAIAGGASLSLETAISSPPASHDARLADSPPDMRNGRKVISSTILVPHELFTLDESLSEGVSAGKSPVTDEEAVHDSPPERTVSPPKTTTKMVSFSDAVRGSNIKDVEDAENVEDVKNAEDARDSESTKNVEDAKDARDSENAEDAKDVSGPAMFAMRQQKRLDQHSQLRSQQFSSEAPESSASAHMSMAVYPLADPFAILYETERVMPLYPDHAIPEEEEEECVEVDGDVEYIRRKRYRVDPERASRVSRAMTMCETTKPASRRTSYVPVSRASLATPLRSSILR